MTRPHKWDWLHRDAEGSAVLVGPNCPDCLRREVARYGCSSCDAVWEIPGMFKWSWQGKGHYHRPDDEEAWHRAVTEHWHSHNGKCVIVPAG